MALSLSAFLPRKGPIVVATAPREASEIAPRSRAWELAYLELSMLDCARRPLRGPHMVLVDVICIMARNDSPLTISPRWLGELFEMVNRVATLKVTANNWSLEASPDMGPGWQAYISAVATNIENDQRRSRRRRFKFRIQEDETAPDDAGRPLACPDADRAVPPVPAGLAAHRPCLWLPAPCVVPPPERERDPSSDFSDVTSDIPDPERRPSEVQKGRQYRSAPGPPLGRRYSLDLINKNPPRGYQPSLVLYGVETDSSLLRPAMRRDAIRPGLSIGGDRTPLSLRMRPSVRKGAR